MIDRAIKLAYSSKCPSQHGAVIASGNRVLGQGVNDRKIHPTWGGGPIGTLHAEAAAIRDAVRKGIDLKGKDIYVARVHPLNMMSKPCKSCQKLIEQHGIRRVFYTDQNGVVKMEYLCDMENSASMFQRQRTD